MPVKVVSDFWEPYDVFFGNEGFEFRRMTTEGMSKMAALNYLYKIGLRVPAYGVVYDLKKSPVPNYTIVRYHPLLEDEIKNDRMIVVYLDPMAHKGEGKIKTTARVAIADYPDKYYSEYVETHGVSFKYLGIGRRRFWFKCWSTESWQSNVGDGDMVYLGEVAKGETISQPIFSIDFVQSDSSLLAIDYNSAPSIPKALYTILPASAIAKEIENYICR